MKRTRWFLAACLALSLLLLAACSSGAQKSPAAGTGGNGAAPAKDYGELHLALQPGTSYLPAQVIVDKKLMEKRLPGIKVTDVKLGSGGGVREAMVAGSIDVGFMGLGHVLIGWDKGIDWKIAAAMNEMPLQLNTNRPGVTSLRDLTKKDRIALPSPGSNQHIYLAMEADKIWGDPKALDGQIVALPHPDGELALYAKGEITFHYTSPPFQARELKQPGVYKVLTSYDTMGQSHTFNVAVVTRKFKEERPEVYQAFIESMAEALDWIKNNPGEAADIMIAHGDKSSREALIAEISDPLVKWDINPHGLAKVAAFMKKAGYITKDLPSWQEITWENLHGGTGN